MMKDCRLVDDDLFDAMADGRLDEKSVVAQVNGCPYCPDCPDTPMQLCMNEYKCVLCGRTECADITGIDINTLKGANILGRYRNAEGYVKTQREAIVKLLKANNEAYTGDKFAPELLDEVASQYNMIQNLVEEIYDEDGKVKGTKKFVRRSNIKDEVLSYLIYLACVNHGSVRKKKDIAAFMKLQTNGFSSGEKIVNDLHAEGKINIEIGDEPVSGFAARYLEGLGLAENQTTDNYIKFIDDIIHTAEAKNIGVNSITSSKVVGTIWLLNVQLVLNIKVDQLERAGDNTKKNTFIKFYNEVTKNIKLFAHIFRKYNIPLPK